MPIPDIDLRPPERRARDEHIASESKLAPLELPSDACWSSMELNLRRRPIAVAGIVENGMVRPLEIATFPQVCGIQCHNLRGVSPLPPFAAAHFAAPPLPCRTENVVGAWWSQEPPSRPELQSLAGFG